MTQRQTRAPALAKWDVPDAAEGPHTIDLLRELAGGIDALTGGGLCLAAS